MLSVKWKINLIFAAKSTVYITFGLLNQMDVLVKKLPNFNYFLRQQGFHGNPNVDSTLPLPELINSVLFVKVIIAENCT